MRTATALHAVPVSEDDGRDAGGHADERADGHAEAEATRSSTDAGSCSDAQTDDGEQVRPGAERVET